MRLLSAAFIILLSLPLHAAETVEETVTWYDVELIVFRNLDTRTTETWPPDAGMPAIADARALFPPPSVTASEARVAADIESDGMGEHAPVPYVPLDESEHQLEGVYASLQRSSKYEPVLHVAWTQPPLEREQSPRLRITQPDALAPLEIEELPGGVSGDAVNDSGEPLLGLADDIAPAQDIPEFLATPESEESLARPLDGTVQLSVGRYLHLDLDLAYLPEDLNLNVLDDDVQAATREWTKEEQLARDARHRDILEALARGDITLEEAEILSLEPEQNVFQGFRLNQYRRVRSRELNFFDHPAYGAIVVVTPRDVPVRLLDATAAPNQ